MYTSFFGLTEKPFAITPDPRYLYMSERHAEALAHLMYGISEAGGFVQLTGEVGTGKTTIVRSLLGQIPQNADIALILNPRLTPAEFLLTICEELHVAVPEFGRNSTKELFDALGRQLLQAHSRGRRVVVIADEAQNLSFEVLEQVRLLTNLETPTQKLLQIILIGQPELRDVLRRVELRQLAQRITGRYHLRPLSGSETASYVRHRLRVAGATAELFTPGAMREVHRLTHGIPRVINVICDRCLLGAYTQDTQRITGAIVRRAAREVYGRPVMPLWTRWVAGGVIAAGVCLFALGAWQLGGAGALRWLHSTVNSNAQGVTAAAATAGQQTKLPAVARAGTPETADGVGALPATFAQLIKPMNGAPADGGTASSYMGLFKLWNAEYQNAEGGEACVQASDQGLDCVTQRGSWAQLRALNRPAILMLTDDAGAAHQLVVTRLGDDQATVLYGGRQYQLTVADISRYWFGDFLVLWRPQVAGAKPLSVGMQGDAVRWLRQSLEHVKGVKPSAADADIFDDSLVRLVEDFQRDHRLAVDGIAGKQTQMVLDSALASPDTPLLSAPQVQGG